MLELSEELGDIEELGLIDNDGLELGLSEDDGLRELEGLSD